MLEPDEVCSGRERSDDANLARPRTDVEHRRAVALHKQLGGAPRDAHRGPESPRYRPYCVGIDGVEIAIVNVLSGPKRVRNVVEENGARDGVHSARASACARIASRISQPNEGRGRT